MLSNGPASSVSSSHHYHQSSYSRQSTYSSSAAGQQQPVSLPYMSRSISVDSYSAENRQKQPQSNTKTGKLSSKNCELEEYARRSVNYSCEEMKY